MKKICFLLLSVLLFGACSTTNIVTMTVVDPAPVTLPASIKKVGIINRSNAIDKNNLINKIDQVLSGETKNLDKDGAKECISGMQNELLSNKRFDEIKVLDQLDLRGPGMGIMPAPLSQDDVNKICRANDVDALFALESYDTNSKITTTSAPVNINTPLGGIPAIEFTATMRTEIKTGWRIYDPMASGIVDEYRFSDHLTFTGRGINPIIAAAGLIERKEAVNQVSNKAGHAYALRIVPFSVRVARDYYVRGTDNFEIATRKARTGNWDEAAELWKKETTNSDPKIAGRAYYNMAIINEIHGNLDLAVDWAQKSYENYNNPLALRYVNILKDRQVRNNILKQQEESEK